MKNRVFLLMALCGCCGNWSCNDDEQLTNTKAQWPTPEQIEKNSVVLDSAFSLTIKALGSADKIKKLAAAESEENFIRQMDLLTKNVFDESIEIAWKVKSEPYRNPRYDAARLVSYNLNTQLIDPLRSYASAIEKDATRRGGHEGEIDIHGIVLSHNDVVEALEVFELIMKHDDPQTLDDAIDDFFAEHQSPVLVGLLLPAVQAAREAAARGGVRRDLHDFVMRDVLITSNQTVLHKQQQKAAGYLGGLDLLVSGEFKKGNENFVWLETMRAIYLNTTAQLWHQAWMAYH